jgi:peptide/nickel transport system substrate-binding protein/nickel transport system substrate-binding protein
MLFLILILGIAGCGSREASPGKKADTETVLRLGAMSDFKAYWESCTLVGDPLVGMDENYNPTPWLIRSWEINDNATEYILQLQEGVKYSDGTPFNAEVCKYDIEVLGAAYYCNYTGTMERLEIIDEYTLRVVFKTTDLNFLKELMKIPGMKIDSLDDNGSFADHTGTGPFILTEYEENVEAALVRNDNYWNKNCLPHVTEVKWIVIADADARVMALQSGQVDAIGITENTESVSKYSVAALRGNENYRILSSARNAYDAVFSVGMNWKKRPLNDARLREALEYAVDREMLVDTVYFGVSVVCGHMMNPAFDDGSSQVDAFTYDLDKAKNILSESGYVLENGVLSKNGDPIKLEYVTTTGKEDTDLAVFIQSAFKEIGIVVNITTLDSVRAEERMKSGDYDLTLGLYWFAPTVIALSYYGIGDEYNSMGPYGGLGFGVTGELTTLAQAVISATNNGELRKAADAFWAANYEACPTIPFSGRVRTAIYNPEWTGFVFNYNYHVIDLSGVRRN